MSKKKRLLLLLILFSGAAFSQTPHALEQKARKYIQNKERAAAMPVLEKILREQPNNFFATFERSRLLFLGEQAEKYKLRHTAYRFTNFQSFFDSLFLASELAKKAKKLYGSFSEKGKARAQASVAATDYEITTAHLHKIENEAFKLIERAPYRKKTTLLYSSGMYDRVKDAEKVLRLREALLEQCGQFIAQYPRNMYVKIVANYQKEMLAEYLNIEDLRRYGERDGGMYEKYCADILKLYTSEELKFIVPRFYGAEFDIVKPYDKSEAYSALKSLASARKQTTIELLCELNLHYAGFSPEKEAVYQQFIAQLAPHDIARIAVQKKAAFYVNRQEWEAAAAVYEKYGALFPQWATFFEKTIALLRDDTPPRQLKNMGSAINSIAHDYNPVMTADGKTLYFARKNADTGEDIYYSHKIGDKWQSARKLAESINTHSHEIPVSISPDNKKLIIYGNYSKLPKFNYVNLIERNLGKGDFYYTEKKKGKWGKIKVFPHPINSKHYETGLSLTADGKAAIFASDRPGGVGGYKPNYPPEKLYYHGAGEFNLDLYVVEKTENGWGKPINLGKTINTPFAETNPYLHPDMETLYFSSDGHYGLGGYDIYVSKRLDPKSWTAWSPPVNIGKAINSPYDDTFYLTAGGNKALMVSGREKNSFGKRDIYAVGIPEKHQGKPVSLLKTQITDDHGKGVPAIIRWQEMDNPSNKGSFKTDRDGHFFRYLAKGKQYVFYPEAENRFGNSVILDLNKTEKTPFLHTDTIVFNSIDLKNTARTPIILKTLHFDHNSDVIRPESYFDLNRLAELLKNRPELYIRIEGHTDSDGNDAFNLDLSERRAKAVAEYLRKKGVAEKIKSAKGFGERKPRKSNQNAAGKQTNRRVEFIVID